jgi:hypothetical protein
MTPEAADTLTRGVEELTEAVTTLASYVGHEQGNVLRFLDMFLTPIAAIVLATVTVWSVFVLRKQRKAAIMPSIIVRTDEKRAKMLNVGNGIAVNVEAWVTDARAGVCSHVTAESIGGKVPDFPDSWQTPGGPRDFGKGVMIWIRYQDAEMDWYHSHRDYERRWEIKPGKGKLPADLEGSDLIGEWEQ